MESSSSSDRSTISHLETSVNSALISPSAFDGAHITSSYDDNNEQSYLHPEHQQSASMWNSPSANINLTTSDRMGGTSHLYQIPSSNPTGGILDQPFYSNDTTAADSPAASQDRKDFLIGADSPMVETQSPHKKSSSSSPADVLFIPLLGIVFLAWITTVVKAIAIGTSRNEGVLIGLDYKGRPCSGNHPYLFVPTNGSVFDISSSVCVSACPIDSRFTVGEFDPSLYSEPIEVTSKYVYPSHAYDNIACIPNDQSDADHLIDLIKLNSNEYVLSNRIKSLVKASSFIGVCSFIAILLSVPLFILLLSFAKPSFLAFLVFVPLAFLTVASVSFAIPHPSSPSAIVMANLSKANLVSLCVGCIGVLLALASGLSSCLFRKHVWESSAVLQALSECVVNIRSLCVLPFVTSLLTIPGLAICLMTLSSFTIPSSRIKASPFPYSVVQFRNVATPPVREVVIPSGLLDSAGAYSDSHQQLPLLESTSFRLRALLPEIDDSISADVPSADDRFRRPGAVPPVELPESWGNSNEFKKLIENLQLKDHNLTVTFPAGVKKGRPPPPLQDEEPYNAIGSQPYPRQEVSPKTYIGENIIDMEDMPAAPPLPPPLVEPPFVESERMNGPPLSAVDGRPAGIGDTLGDTQMLNERSFDSPPMHTNDDIPSVHSPIANRNKIEQIQFVRPTDVLLFSLSSSLLIEFVVSCLRFLVATWTCVWFFSIPDFRNERVVTSAELGNSTLLVLRHLGGSVSLCSVLSLLVRWVSYLSVVAYPFIKVLNSRKPTRKVLKVLRESPVVTQFLSLCHAVQGDSVTECVLSRKDLMTCSRVSEWRTHERYQVLEDIRNRLRLVTTSIPSFLSLSLTITALRLITNLPLFCDPSSKLYIPNPLFIVMCIGLSVHCTVSLLAESFNQMIDTMSYCCIVERFDRVEPVCTPSVLLVTSLSEFDLAACSMMSNTGTTHMHPLQAPTCEIVHEMEQHQLDNTQPNGGHTEATQYLLASKSEYVDNAVEIEMKENKEHHQHSPLSSKLQQYDDAFGGQSSVNFYSNSMTTALDQQLFPPVGSTGIDDDDSTSGTTHVLLS